LARLAKRNFPLFSLSQMIFTVETPISTLITIKKASPTTTQQLNSCAVVRGFAFLMVNKMETIVPV
jgi:hypothetical protein